ncbi:CDP-glycerol glycerophosphotransferase family protein [Thomasclavelia sp.]
MKNRIRMIDIEAIIKFALAIPFAVFLRRKNIWLFSERPEEARDNAYILYKYIKENKDKKNIYYVIGKKSDDADLIKKIGGIIEYNSFKHYIYYLASYMHISAHVDSDSPNSRVSNFLEVNGFLNNKKVFLQHGITKDKISFGYYSVCRADLFVCGAKKEYEFCKREFGFPEGNVQLLGFPRFDNLWDCAIKRQILLMPTWRVWLANQTKECFLESEYYKKYNELLSDKNLISILNKKNLYLCFLPHSDMKNFVNCFNIKNERIKIINFSDVQIQKILKESIMLITDYSSVAFDFAYMNKPVVYYHFDYDEYRKNQHPEGYFKYAEDGFGPVLTDSKSICEYIDMVSNNFKNSQKYEKRVCDFFDLRDKNNCKRVYEKIVELEEK